MAAHPPEQSDAKFHGLLDTSHGPHHAAYEAAEKAQLDGQSLEMPSRGMPKKARRKQLWKGFVKKKPAKEMAFPRKAVKRTVREVLPEGYSISAAGLDCLHQAAEVAIVQLFKDSLVMAKHSSRLELYPADMRVVAGLRPNDITFRGWDPQGPASPRKRRRGSCPNRDSHSSPGRWISGFMDLFHNYHCILIVTCGW